MAHLRGIVQWSLPKSLDFQIKTKECKIGFQTQNPGWNLEPFDVHKLTVNHCLASSRSLVALSTLVAKPRPL